MPRKRKLLVFDEQLSEPPAKRRLPSSAVAFEKLPIDVLVEVAKYLPLAQWPSLERVDSTFRDAIYEAWRTVRKIRLDHDLLAIDSREIIDSEMINVALKKLTRRAVNIVDIGGFGEENLNIASIDLLIRFEKLERIEFGKYNASLGDLEKFLKRSASRGKLKEVNASGSLMRWSPPSQEPLFEACSEQDGLAPLKLETFDLSGNRGLAVSSPFLNAVDVSRLTSFLVISTRVNRSLLANFLKRANNLQRVAFGFDCYCDVQPPDELVWHSAEPGPTQLVLQLNKRIIRAVSNLDRLASLKMNTCYPSLARPNCGCRNFDVEMTELFNELGRRGALVELSLRPYLDTAAMMNSIAMALPNLHSLELYVNSNGATAAEDTLKAQKSLTSLRVHCASLVPNFRIVPHILANALHLKSLHLDLGAGVRFQKYQLLQIAAFKRLKELSVCISRSHIDDEVLAAWAESFGSELESLAIRWYKNVTDEGLLALMKKTRHLRKLDVSNSKITDRGLKEMAAECREIRKLDLSYCRAITAEGVQAVVDGCDHLKQLHMAGNFELFRDKLKIGKYRNILLRSIYIRSVENPYGF